MLIDPIKTYTYKDYILYDENERIEIIDGTIYNMSPAPSRIHQKIIMELSAEIRNYIKANKLQWWRLRNCNWFFRIVIYTIIFIFCFLMLLNSFLLSAQDQPLDFVAFGTFLKQFLAVYVVGFMFFDYRFVQRARNKVLQIPKFEVGEQV